MDHIRKNNSVNVSPDNHYQTPGPDPRGQHTMLPSVQGTNGTTNNYNQFGRNQLQPPQQRQQQQQQQQPQRYQSQVRASSELKPQN
jgi:hypothetical protein